MRSFFGCKEAKAQRGKAIKKLCISTLFFAFCILHFALLPVFSEPIIENPLPADNKPLECGVTFDWISKTQFQRDENIKEIQNNLFNEKTILKYPKKEFRAKNAEFLKDKDSLQHYIDISNGKKEDDDKFYAGFFLKNGLLVAYGIQNKNNLKNIYYYDAMGHLRFIDYFSDNYPKFPYYALQYDTSGKLIGTIYFVSVYDQYIFNPDKTFKGRWYKNNMYNRNAKVILTRSNY